MWQRVYNKVQVSTRALLDRWIIRAIQFILVTDISPGGEVVNASVCKTDMRGFDSRPGLTCQMVTPARVVELVDTQHLNC